MSLRVGVALVALCLFIELSGATTYARCDPYKVRNGYYRPRRNGGFRYGQRIAYYCDRYYRLAGYDSYQCDTDGWNYKTPPRCVPICARPDDPDNGDVTTRPRGSRFISKDDSVRFSCDDGFQLSGDAVVTCEGPNTWDEDFPTCRRIPRCSRPDNPDNGVVVSKPNSKKVFDVNEKVWFRCNVGFRLSGPGDLTCERSGGWDREFPSCDRIPRCSRPDNPDNGVVVSKPNSKKVFDVNEKVWFRCNVGFRLSGPGDLTCEGFEDWDRDFPTCDRIPRCSRPDNPDNGVVVSKPNSKKVFDVNEKVWFRCNVGFRLSGLGDLTCEGFEDWDREFPSCDRIPRCSRPDNPDNGVVVSKPNSKKVFDVNEKVWFRCNVGFRLSGPGDLTCEGFEDWDRNFPTCDRISTPKCPRPKNPKNGYVTSRPNNKQYFSKGEKVWFQCSKYYAISGYKDITCTSAGTWNRNPPTCKGSCKDRCRNGRYDSRAPCRCNRLCRVFKRDCCDDYKSVCQKRRG